MKDVPAMNVEMVNTVREDKGASRMPAKVMDKLATMMMWLAGTIILGILAAV